MRRLLRIVAWLVLGAVALVSVIVAWAHVSIRSLGGPLPTNLEALDADDLPVSLQVVNTASQRLPRSQVLDSGRDPTPDRPYEMAHPSFRLEWGDGRVLLVDLGMEPDAAIAFGRTLELVGGAPAEPHGSVVGQLGHDAVQGPLGLVFTHLHTDHTEGIGALCAAREGAPIRLFQTRAQAELRNYTTRPGAAQVETAGCTRVERLAERPLAPLPGFPGVGVIWAAGHTPGSQVVLVAVRGATGVRRLALAGDVANAIDGIRHDVPKPLLYRLLMVPEDDARLGEMRRFLAHLEQAGFDVVPSHDLLHLRSLGLPFVGDPEGDAQVRSARSAGIVAALASVPSTMAEATTWGLAP
jgi:glyoxylase-like metal-dependent hydrolase (beta-lactamase superfamily II)